MTISLLITLLDAKRVGFILLRYPEKNVDTLNHKVKIKYRKGEMMPMQTDKRLNSNVPGADALLLIRSNRYGTKPDTSIFHSSELAAVVAYWESINREIVSTPVAANMPGRPDHMQVDVLYRPW